MIPARRKSVATLAAALAIVAAVAGCAATPTATPPIMPGTPDAPRPVNVILKDYLFIPNPVELVRGETVEFNVINGGLIVHDMVVGGPEVQAAWEAAEASAGPPPPGETPRVSAPPELAGLRVVLASGETRTGIRYTVPPDGPLQLGCHIPGHWAEGMAAEVRFVTPPVP